MTRWATTATINSRGRWGERVATCPCDCDGYRPDIFGGGDLARQFLDHHVPAGGFVVISEQAIGLARTDLGYAGVGQRL